MASFANPIGTTKATSTERSTLKMTKDENSELPLYLSVMDRPSREEGSFAHLAKRFILPPMNHALFDLLNITEGRLTFLDLWLSYGLFNLRSGAKTFEQVKAEDRKLIEFRQNLYTAVGEFPSLFSARDMRCSLHLLLRSDRICTKEGGGRKRDCPYAASVPRPLFCCSESSCIETGHARRKRTCFRRQGAFLPKGKSPP